MAVNVSAIIVTRGDVDLAPVIKSLPERWEKILWYNGDNLRYIPSEQEGSASWLQRISDEVLPDLSVYGRYAAIEYASNDLIYIQDDDVIVSDPQAIVDALFLDGDFVKRDGTHTDRYGPMRDAVVCNMPPEFRHDFYTDHALVGFGAAFHRDTPGQAFAKWNAYHRIRVDGSPVFNRTCDVIFTTLTPRVFVDVPKSNREFASDDNRMWKQPSHVGERKQMLDLARKVRDGS